LPSDHRVGVNYQHFTLRELLCEDGAHGEEEGRPRAVNLLAYAALARAAAGNAVEVEVEVEVHVSDVAKERARLAAHGLSIQGRAVDGHNFGWQLRAQRYVRLVRASSVGAHDARVPAHAPIAARIAVDSCVDVVGHERHRAWFASQFLAVLEVHGEELHVVPEDFVLALHAIAGVRVESFHPGNTKSQ